MHRKENISVDLEFQKCSVLLVSKMGKRKIIKEETFWNGTPKIFQLVNKRSMRYHVPEFTLGSNFQEFLLPMHHNCN